MENHISDMADELATEVLSEAADTFFGQRKDLELEMELFHQKVKTLSAMGNMALCAQKIMHAVLLDASLVRDFYQVLEVAPPPQIERAAISEVASRACVPFAWTMKGRYFKLLLNCYTACHTAIDEYMNGGHRGDPNLPRRKVAIFGYLKIQAWASQINQKVSRMNREQAPSEVLRFMKGLDILGSEMEKCMGPSCQVARDSGLLFPKVDFTSLCLPVFPALPAPLNVRSVLGVFCKKLFPGRKPDIRLLLRQIRFIRNGRLRQAG